MGGCVQDENALSANAQAATCDAAMAAKPSDEGGLGAVAVLQAPSPCRPSAAAVAGGGGDQAAQHGAARAKLTPSGAELERRYFEAKQRERRLANERSCHRAIHFPDAPGSARRQRSRDATTDKGSDAVSDAGSENEDGTWPGSLRRGEAAPHSKARAWRPELTTPAGPRLRTELRQRARSSSRPRAPADAAGADVPPASASVDRWSESLRSGARRPPPRRARSSGGSRGGSASASPARSEASCRSARSWRPDISAPSLPRRGEAPASPRQARRAWSRGRATPSPARSDASARTGDTASGMSLATFGSRMSQMSQRSQQQLSSDQIERAQVDAKRREVRELMRLNEKTYKEAIKCPDIHRRHHSVSATMPEEFEFSTRSSRAGRAPGPGACEEAPEPGAWARSLRREAAPAWQPQLTLPRGPALQTAGRSRSLSSVRSERSASGRSMSRGRTPREDGALQAHLRRAEAAQEERARYAAEEQTRSLRPEQAPPAARGPPGAAAARAEQARAAALARQEAALASARQHLCVFRPAAGGPAGSEVEPTFRGGGFGGEPAAQ